MVNAEKSPNFGTETMLPEFVGSKDDECQNVAFRVKDFLNVY